MSANVASVDERTHPRVLLFCDRPEEFQPGLAARFPTAQLFSCATYAGLPDALERARPHVVFADKFERGPFPRETLLACASVTWLSIALAGVDHVVPWDDERLVVTNAAGVAAEEMAQYIVGAIFALHQRFPYFARRQAEHRWDYQLVRSATGARVGIVGLGHTGTAAARLCRQVGLRVVACRATGAASDAVERVYPAGELHAMLREVDVVVLSAALTQETRNLFNAAAFGAMRAGSFFINVARGAMVEEPALLEALRSGQLAGAIIDVARHEPLPAADPLWDAPNLLITPHTSSEYVGWQARAVEMFAENLERWMSGAPLANRVFAHRGY